jgi:transposase InsO family protein
MKRIAIDYIENLRPDQDENDMIVVMIDCFSRFVCLFPVRSKNTEVFLSSYLKWLGLGLGEPAEILTDRGSQFTSRLTMELVKRVGHKLIFTTTNSKQENAIVERANRESMRHLRNIIMDKRAIDE